MVSDLDYMIGDIIYSWSKGEKAEFNESVDK